MSYQQEIVLLSPLESFDPNAFVGDAATPQSVCDFILSLALAYNDLRDVILTRLLLAEVKPAKSRTPEQGQYGGLVVAIIRIQAGRVHELLNLIGKSGKETESPAFQKVLKSISGSGRDAWSSLSAVAHGKPSASPLAQALLFVRNKVGFHYDPKELRRGYEIRFKNSNSPAEPVLSRGGSMQRSRFYFADAAAESYIHHKDDDPSVNDFFNGKGEALNHINAALYEIVTKFIGSRGFAWRQPR